MSSWNPLHCLLPGSVACCIAALPFPAAAEKPGADAPSFFFDGPEVLKLDWDTRCPRCADFNGDGLPDLAAVSAARGRIDFLLQRRDGVKSGAPEASSRTDRWNPVLEVSRFDKRPFVTGVGAFTLAVGDWNGDKKPDIAYTTDEEKLVLRYQGKEFGDWTERKEFALDSVTEDTETLAAADLNGDGRDDLCVLTQTRLIIYLQQAAGAWSEPRAYALAESGSAGLRVADLNGDRRPDLFYTAPGGDAVLVRLQQGETGFGEEWRLEVPDSRCWAHPLHLGGGQTGIAWIQSKTGLVEIARLASGEALENTGLAATIRFSMPPADSKTGASALGDLTGDGTPDVVLSDPKNARVWLFKGLPDGSFEEGKSYPSLSGVEGLAIADANADGKPDLIVASAAERTIALATWEKSRLTYPEPIHHAAAGEQIVALAAGRSGAQGGTCVQLVIEARSKTSLTVLRWDGAARKWEAKATELPGAPSKIIGMRLLDADQDGRMDVALFSSFSALQILLSREDAKAPFLRVEGLPDSLASKLPPTGLTEADIDGDGKTELIASRDQFARVFKVGADGKVRIVDQLNAPDAASKISAVLPGGSAGRHALLMLDAGLAKIHEMLPDTDGVWRVKHSHAMPAVAVNEARIIGADKGRRLLLLGQSSFELAPLEGDALHLKTLATFESELKDTDASDLLPAAFSGGGIDDLLTVDSAQSRVLEFFHPSAGKVQDWRSAMYFRVFDADPQYRGKAGFKNEPHDYAAMDLNNDGRLDLCLLVHDRMLIYIRQP